MEIHQHSNGLADDERDPHSGVAIVPVEEATHKPSQRNLRQKKKKVHRCEQHVTLARKRSESESVLPEPSFPQRPKI